MRETALGLLQVTVAGQIGTVSTLENAPTSSRRVCLRPVRATRKPSGCEDGWWLSESVVSEAASPTNLSSIRLVGEHQDKYDEWRRVVESRLETLGWMNGTPKFERLRY